MLADERGRATVTGLLHQVLVAFLAGVTGIMAVLLLGAAGGPQVTPTIGLYQLIGYFLLVISFILGLRVLAPVFRRGGGLTPPGAATRIEFGEIRPKSASGTTVLANRSPDRLVISAKRPAEQPVRTTSEVPDSRMRQTVASTSGAINKADDDPDTAPDGRRLFLASPTNNRSSRRAALSGSTPNASPAPPVEREDLREGLRPAWEDGNG